MWKQGRRLLVHFQNEMISEKEELSLRQILQGIEIPGQFCIAHELVDRNSITSDKKKIIKESSRKELRPFRFLINKN